MPGMRLMVRALFAGVSGRFFSLVMMERQHQRHRQNHRQQQDCDGSPDVLDSLHRIAKIAIIFLSCFPFQSMIAIFLITLFLIFIVKNIADLANKKESQPTIEELVKNLQSELPLVQEFEKSVITQTGLEARNDSLPLQGLCLNIPKETDAKTSRKA